MKVQNQIMKTQLFLITISSFLVLSCAQTDADKIGEAQLCLDKSTATTATACMEKVSGINTAGAYNIRCSAMFIQEGFSNGTKITNAFNAISGGVGGGNGLNFMDVLMFSSKSAINTDYSNTVATYGYCYLSQGKGALLLSTYSYLAIALQKYLIDNGATGCNSTPPYQFVTCLGHATAIAPLAAALDVNTANANASSLQSAMGAVIRTLYTVSCTGSGSNQSLCSSMQTAINAAGSNDRQLFVSLITSMQ